MYKLVSGLVTGLRASAPLAAPADAATLTVRVEGASTTLVPLTRVATAPGQIVKDGTCGSTGPEAPAPEPSTPASPAVGPDRTPPVARTTAIPEGRVFARDQGPRVLRGLLTVKLRLTRNDGGHCSSFSRRLERLRPARCGATHARWFAIGSSADWSYLLPTRVPRGRYVPDVNAIDKSYNRDDARRRGGNRLVFVVR
jgi:hypothetical protein